MPLKGAERWQSQQPAVEGAGGEAWIKRQSAHDAALCSVAPVAVERGLNTKEELCLLNNWLIDLFRSIALSRATHCP